MTRMVAQQESAPFVELFILSRDRVEYCRQAVRSAVSQTYSNFRVIVSDNSEGNEVDLMLRKEFPSVQVVRRRPTMRSIEHFNQVLKEISAPLMVLFHDDDVLEKNYVAQMVDWFEEFPDVVAIGCNARILRASRLTKEKLMGSFNETRLLKRQLDLFEPYLSLSLIAPAPFPGYMYRSESIKNLALLRESGGKHADVTFLSQVLERGSILWKQECLMQYRLHGNNDSNLECISDRLSWLRYVYKVTGLNSKSIIVRDFKFVYWRRWLLQEKLGAKHECSNDASILGSYGQKIVRRFVRRWGMRLAMTRFDFWLRAWRRLKKI